VIGRIVKPLIALFVEDELLAAGILIAVAAVAALTLLAAAPGGLVALLLVLAFPALLAGSVLRSVKRAHRSMAGGRRPP